MQAIQVKLINNHNRATSLPLSPEHQLNKAKNFLQRRAYNSSHPPLGAITHHYFKYHAKTRNITLDK